jgi:hypothetical protein
MNTKPRLPITGLFVPFAYLLLFPIIHENLFGRYREASPSEPIPTISGAYENVPEIIKFANFHIDRSRDLCSVGALKLHVPTRKRCRT